MTDALPPRGALRRARAEIGPGLADLLRSGDPPPEAVEASRLPERRLGRYVLVRMIGRGAMAAVWKAWDLELNRWVAVKLLEQADEAHRPRFLREAKTAAGLAHPNLVRVFDAGESGGRLFLVMELIDGRPLDVRQPLASLVGALAKIASGLEEAHRKGIVHRDVKPANIMVDGAGEPHVVDFGLAHLAGDHLRITKSGATVGTPIYMAPEQVAGRGREIGPATDVYALGVILYEGLAGRPPFLGESATEIYGRILSDDPALPRTINAAAPRDLETIALKAIDKDPARRYGSAADFAEDLGRYLAGEPILARRASLFHQGRRWLARRRTLVAAAAGIAAVLAIWVVLSGRLSRTEEALDLWSRISNLLAESELLARGGETARAREKLDAGVAVCRDFLAGRDLPHAHYFLGRLLHAKGDLEGAEAALTRALDLDPGLGEARLERGLVATRAYFMRFRRVGGSVVEEVEETGERVFPTSADCEALFPDLKALRERAIADLAAAGGRSSFYREADRRYGEAVLAFARGETGRARQELLAILEEDPLDARAHLLFAEIADREGDFDEMLARLDAAIACHRGNSEAYLGRATVRRVRSSTAGGGVETRRWLDLAFEDADRAVKLGTWPAFALSARAFVRAGQGDLPGAIADLTEALALSPGDAEIHVNRASLRQDAGDLAGAIEDCTKALELDPSLVEAWHLRGMARVDARDAAGAIGDFDKALARRPSSAFIRIGRGIALMESGDLDGAIAQFTEVIGLAPKAARAHHNRANAWNRKGQPDRAFEDYSRAIELRPGLPQPWFSRSNIHRRRGDNDAALADLDRAIAADPRYLKAYVNRGSLRRDRYREQRREADRDAAVADYEKAVELGPAPELRGQIDEALKELRGAKDF